MDGFTHAMYGGLLGRGFFAERRRHAAWLCAWAAEFPDVDFALGLTGNPDVMLREHRGFTHSFAGLVPTAAAAALLWWAGEKALAAWNGRRDPTAKPAPPFLSAFLLCLPSVLSHIGLDLLTSWGTQILYPFDRTRFAWDVTFILDPYFTGILAAGLLLPAVRIPPQALARTALAAVALYWGFCVAMRDAAIHAVRARWTSAEPILTVDAVPQPLSPLSWRVVVGTGRAWHQAVVHVGSGEPPSLVRTERECASPLLAAAKSGPRARTFLWFARFPVVACRAEPPNTVFEFSDSRFALAGRKPFFAVRVVVDPAGRVLSEERLR